MIISSNTFKYKDSIRNFYQNILMLRNVYLTKCEEVYKQYTYVNGMC